MKVEKFEFCGIDIARIRGDKPVIRDVNSALDLIASTSYETGTQVMIIDKELFPEEFFDLKTKLAGDILQKFTTYQMTVAILGDYSGYSSKSLKDFMYESNKGKHIYFVSDEEEALKLIKKNIRDI